MPPVDDPEPTATQWVTLVATDRVAALRDFVAGWYADVPAHPTATGDADRGDVAVPPPLRQFYRAAAGRAVVYGVQNAIRPVDRLVPDADGWVGFADENQGAFTLRYRPGPVDPPVRCDDGRTAVDEAEPLSGVLLQFVLSEAAVGAPVGGFGWLGPTALHRLTSALRTVPLAPAGWRGGPVSLHAGPGLVVAVAAADSDGDHHVFVGARHRPALDRLRPLDLPWEEFDALGTHGA
ncbi:hypothetical protein [Solwaraspora sp. WMMA2101]|uniref:hypothetical protein n=1 Tax=Solwaraspora sp. WMMA2101 TaxID=3404124 RepID=UPI003B9620E2